MGGDSTDYDTVISPYWDLIPNSESKNLNPNGAETRLPNPLFGGGVFFGVVRLGGVGHVKSIWMVTTIMVVVHPTPPESHSLIVQISCHKNIKLHLTKNSLACDNVIVECKALNTRGKQ